MKEERVREIRNLAKHDELLQKIIDEIFRMANAELDQPLINYEELIGRPHRTSKEEITILQKQLRSEDSTGCFVW